MMSLSGVVVIDSIGRGAEGRDWMTQHRTKDSRQGKARQGKARVDSLYGLFVEKIHETDQREITTYLIHHKPLRLSLEPCPYIRKVLPCATRHDPQNLEHH